MNFTIVIAILLLNQMKAKVKQISCVRDNENGC